MTRLAQGTRTAPQPIPITTHGQDQPWIGGVILQFLAQEPDIAAHGGGVLSAETAPNLLHELSLRDGVTLVVSQEFQQAVSVGVSGIGSSPRLARRLSTSITSSR